MSYVSVIIAPFVYLWDTLFGAREITIDHRHLLEEVKSPVRAPLGAMMITTAKVYRKPVVKITEKDGGSYIYSKKKLQVLGEIDRREARLGEPSSLKTTEIVRERRELTPNVWVNPRDVIEFDTYIEEVTK